MRNLLLTLALSISLTAGPLSATPSTTPSQPPAGSPAPMLTLTEAELLAIVQEAMDKAVAPERAARLAAEAKLRAYERAIPWAVSGAVILAAGAFVWGLSVQR